jgi:transposase
MMNGREKSDSAIVATKPANNAGAPAAEWGEPRAGTKGNTDQSHTCRAQNRVSVPQALERVRQAARQRKKERFTALLHHVTIDRLRKAFFALKRNAAPGAAAEVKRWSANRKKQVVLRLLRGEPVDAISREVSVPIYRLEEWRERALAGIDAGLKERENDPLEAKLGEATRRIGELVMENELLRKERQARHPLVNRRSSK